MIISIHDTVGDILQGGYTDDGEFLGGVKKNLVYFLKKLVTNPVPHVEHKLEKVKEISITNHNNAANSRLTQMSEYLYPVAYGLNATRTLLHSAIVLGVELPVELTSREVGYLGGASVMLVAPVGPALAATVITGVGTAYVLVFGVGTTTVAASVGVVLTGVVATLETGVEAGKLLLKLGEPSVQKTESQDSAMLLIPIPQNEAVEQNLNNVFASAQSREDLEQGFDAAVSEVESKDQWGVYGQIVSRLDATIQGLEAAMADKSSEEQVQILAEWDELFALKDVYVAQAAKALQQNGGEIAIASGN
ncbi:MAG: hypothetical protein HYW85_06950 [Deltaproteobacteria bacterium]|nr:hypothetical protein [Deltaproteobacteria bacterium]